ncbi:MAG TPA: D-sedoheptulose 7-phosphate isomerase [Steroidobacteraceae bacterium]|jgi:D-sedoheptulose 7-phosphate isomerase|nr:D-sedoheptulose 7-phosphate isomerase [Steroidobacteraceae bacterium]
MFSATDGQDGSREQLEDLWRAELDEHRAVVEATAHSGLSAFCDALAILESSVRAGGKILLFGNGGSASDAQHIVAELVVRYKTDRAPIAALTLSADTSTLTACANDLGYETIFARQIEALGRKGDVAFAISTSGRSPNVLNALGKARAMRLQTIGLSGGIGGEMRPLCDALIVVPSSTTARIQEMHITVAHMLCKALEQRLGLV